MSARSRICRHAVCYVNANFMIGLDRGDTEAIDFARNNRGCLFTSRTHIEAEFVITPEARERLESLASAYDIRLRSMSRSVREIAESLYAAFVAEARKKYGRLAENTEYDLWHYAAATVLGAKFFVSNDDFLCRMVNSELRDRLQQAADRALAKTRFKGRRIPLCIKWGAGVGCATAENGVLQGAQGEDRSLNSRGAAKRGNRSRRRVGEGRDKLARGRGKAKGAGKGQRKKREKGGKVGGRAPRGARRGKGG